MNVQDAPHRRLGDPTHTHTGGAKGMEEGHAKRKGGLGAISRGQRELERELRRVGLSDPRTPAMPRQRFQISENRFQRAGPDPTGFRFQISDPSAEQADVASPLQMSECRIQMPGAKIPRSIGLRALGENQIISGRSQSKTCYHQYSHQHGGLDFSERE